MVAELNERVGPERALRIADRDRNAGFFPNLVINDIMAITVRTFYPVQPDLMMVRSWALAPIGEEPEARHRLTLVALHGEPRRQHDVSLRRRPRRSRLPRCSPRTAP